MKRFICLVISAILIGLTFVACDSSSKSGGHWISQDGVSDNVQRNIIVWPGPKIMENDGYRNSLWSAVGAVNQRQGAYTSLQLRPEGCIDGRHCITVGFGAPEGYAGTTTRAWGADGHMFGTAAKIKVAYGLNDPEFRTYVFCHELEHAVGLGHSPSGHPGPCDQNTGRPTDWDVELIQQIYSHVD